MLTYTTVVSDIACHPESLFPRQCVRSRQSAGCTSAGFPPRYFARRGLAEFDHAPHSQAQSFFLCQVCDKHRLQKNLIWWHHMELPVQPELRLLYVYMSDVIE